MSRENIISMLILEKDPDTGVPTDFARIADLLTGIGISQSVIVPTYDAPSASRNGQVELRDYDFDREGSLGYVGYDALKDYFKAETPNTNFGNYTKIWNRLSHINAELEDPIIYRCHRDPSTGRVKPAPLQDTLYVVRDRERSDLFVSVDALYRLVADEEIGGPKAGETLKGYLNQRITRHRELCPR